MDTVLIAIGLLGVTVNLTAYALLTAGRLHAGDARYQILNIIGTCGMLLSLIAQWNLPSFVANALWLLIGIFGLARILLRKQKEPS